MKVADGFEQACKIAVDYLSEIATTIEFTEENIDPLVEVALTTLSSKIVNKSLSVEWSDCVGLNVRWLRSLSALCYLSLTYLVVMSVLI